MHKLQEKIIESGLTKEDIVRMSGERISKDFAYQIIRGKKVGGTTEILIEAMCDIKLGNPPFGGQVGSQDGGQAYIPAESLNPAFKKVVEDTSEKLNTRDTTVKGPETATFNFHYEEEEDYPYAEDWEVTAKRAKQHVPEQNKYVKEGNTVYFNYSGVTYQFDGKYRNALINVGGEWIIIAAQSGDWMKKGYFTSGKR